MLKKSVLLTVLLGVVFLGSAFARDFSADVISHAKGNVVQSKMYFTTNKFRMESQKSGIQSTSIARLDKKIMWILMPKSKMYMEMAIPDDQTRGVSTKMSHEVVRKKIGRENINGYNCDKYEVTVTNKSGGKDIIYQWVSDDKVPVKTAAKDGSWSTELKNISFASQPASLFEIPAGYSKQSMPGMDMIKGMMKGMPGR